MNAARAIPANLKELLERNIPGYTLKKGYLLQLKHGLMGFFPAIIKGTDRIVITTDSTLIPDVWKTLTPRKSEVVTNNFYVNEEFSIGFPILGSTDYDNENSKPVHLLTRAEFDALVAGDRQPFEWAPGLIGADISEGEFQQTLETNRQKMLVPA